ncbi:N-acyl-D-amino-acid deacylase family protein [Actinocatenispora rupis]|uniref:Dihydroorotase n=1 Tax=Actinocatenispora rupis TaxID=519421 RepID=A0A8J3JEP5_9ACTN|nr:amidohydrolase family protein [Actinocatenispora rupis]GID15324.1 dihydroorotase [Actinocatenispora rupis]
MSATLLRGGTVFDGTGEPGVPADVLVRGTTIEQVGPALQAPNDATVVDLTGRYVVPGLIDVHTHDDVAILRPSGTEPKLRQGVTTGVVGNCGHGCAPSAPGGYLSDYSAPVLGAFPDTRWPSFADYLDDIAASGRNLHVAALVPHAPLRTAVLGPCRRPATAGEVPRIAGLLDEALGAGAAGLSVGLMYAPGNAATPAELHALARVLARHGKPLVAHLRSEGDAIEDSLAEVVDVARRAGCPLHLSHLKVVSPRNAGRMPALVAILDAHRADGIDITADAYPYPAGSTTVSALFPAWAVDRGVTGLLDALGAPATRRRVLADLRRPWKELENNYLALGPERIRLVGLSRTELDGRTLAELAGDTDPAECLADLVLAERAALSVILFQSDERDLRAALSWPWTMIGSDGLPVAGGAVHPRLYGTFPRVLARYADRLPGLSFAQAVHRMTGLPAHRFGLAGRGSLVPGAAADVTVVDPALLADTATFDDPRRFPTGIAVALLDGRPTADRTGRLLRVRRSGATR